MNNQELQKAESGSWQVQSTKPNPLIGAWIVNKEDLEVAKTMVEKKIGQFSREEINDIVDVLAQWRLLLGVTSDTTEAELIFITQFIYDNYKHFTLSDMKIAKNWAIMGKIDVGFVTQKTFSSYYIARSLNAYEEEKRKIINQINENRERYLRRKDLDNPIKLTPEENARNFKDHIITIYKIHSQGKEIVDIGDMIYNWMKAVGLMKPDSQEVSDALIYATDKVREFNYENGKNQTKLQVDPETDEARKKKYARAYCIGKQFDRMSISAIIEKITIEYFKNK